jgi:UDP-glucose 4-epimerase
VSAGGRGEPDERSAGARGGQGDASAGARDEAARRVLVTGASGLVGSQVVRRLSEGADAAEHVVALDLRLPDAAARRPGVVYETGDVRDPGLAERLREHGIDTVVHLAAIVTPGPESSREDEYAVDVLGTRNVVEACVAAGVRRLVYTSSGAAYGYHADNPRPLRESDPLRGNPEFAYADHKRLAEEELARAREAHPELHQLVLRPGTILGERVASPISALFERRVVVGVRGADAPFVLIWDEDVADCIVHGLRTGASGVYNLCGDGAVPLREIARRLGKPYLPLPGGLLAAALGLLHALRLSARGAEQVDFLRHRPVLSNEALKRDLGFVPRHTSDACFERYRALRFPGRGASLAGRAAFVTGAASGIGLALARRFARAGARVVLADLDEAGAERAAEALRAEGHDAHGLGCDVTDAEACTAALAKARAAVGPIDLLVANAGITHVGRVADTDVSVLRRVLDVNFFGAVHVAKAALPDLLERGGQIVAVGSIAGQAPLATRAGYAASKHALHGFFRSLRAEHGADGLGVLLVDPYFVETAIGDRALGPDGRPAGRRTGVDAHALSADDVAHAILRATLRRRGHAFVPHRAGLYVWLSRLAPGWFERRMARRMEQPGAD